MSSAWIDAIIKIVIMIVTAAIAYVVGFRKNKRADDASVLSNLNDSVLLYQRIVDDLSEKVTKSNEKIDKLTNHISELENKIEELVKENMKLKTKCVFDNRLDCQSNREERE